jgi:multimeric flavodoxin WrbA
MKYDMAQVLDFLREIKQNNNTEWFHAHKADYERARDTFKALSEEILTKMQEADVLVVATPTYFLSMNGMLKTTIDRFLPKWQELGGHEVYFIITGHDGRSGLHLVGEELTQIFEALGNKVRGIVWGEGVWQKGEVRPTKAMDEAFQMGKSV